MQNIYLSDLSFRDWWALYRIVGDPDFYYRAFNDRHAWVAFRAARYIHRAKTWKTRTVKAVRLTDSDKLIGCVILVDSHKEDGKPVGMFETGTFLAVSYQGQKIGTMV